jgi:hypothetical protein
MKKTKTSKPKSSEADDLRPEYRFDYSKARPNRFAGRIADEQVVVMLDADVAQVFRTPESVNNVLRALIAAMSEVKLATPQR